VIVIRGGGERERERERVREREREMASFIHGLCLYDIPSIFGLCGLSVPSFAFGFLRASSK